MSSAKNNRACAPAPSTSQPSTLNTPSAPPQHQFDGAYTVALHTAAVLGSVCGQVQCSVQGVQGQSPWLPLTHPINHSSAPFTRPNSSDVFALSTGADLGFVQQLHFVLNVTGAEPFQWIVDKVQIVHMASGVLYQVPVSIWLSAGHPVLTLPVTAFTQMQLPATAMYQSPDVPFTKPVSSVAMPTATTATTATTTDSDTDSADSFLVVRAQSSALVAGKGHPPPMGMGMGGWTQYRGYGGMQGGGYGGQPMGYGRGQPMMGGGMGMGGQPMGYGRGQPMMGGGMGMGGQPMMGGGGMGMGGMGMGGGMMHKKQAKHAKKQNKKMRKGMKKSMKMFGSWSYSWS